MIQVTLPNARYTSAPIACYSTRTREMPIEISTLKLKRDDLIEGHIYHAPYVPVYLHSYGRMDSSTQERGLMTSRVALCLAVVLHCPTTRRTILTHSPTDLDMATFIPIVDWITGGQGQALNTVTWYEGVSASPCKVEVVVLRVFLYATINPIQYDHNRWLQDFRHFFSKFTSERHIRVDILDATQVLPDGTVLVNKDTARITYLEVKGRAHPSGSIDHCLDVDNPLLPHIYSKRQRSRDLFVATLLASQKECSPLFLQYDVSHYCLPLPLPDEGRQLIRSKKQGEPIASQKAIVKKFNQPSDWLYFITSNNRPLLATFHQSAIACGPPCERCGESGSKQCMACMGAWYCGKKHQEEDWKSHKGWCKAHRIPRPK